MWRWMVSRRPSAFDEVYTSPLVDPAKAGDLLSPVVFNPSWDLGKCGRKNLQVCDSDP